MPRGKDSRIRGFLMRPNADPFLLPAFSNERSPCLASRSKETGLSSAFYARERDAFARPGIYLEKTEGIH